jgi:nucleoid-associated protein YgaU
MGFGVGGVLLAVIIVAVLVVHRNHNKAVVFDTSGKAASPTDSGSGIDANPSPADAGKAAEPSSAGVNPKQPDAKPQPEAPSAQDQWDALFASSASPIKSKLKHGGHSQPPIDAPQADPPAEQPTAEQIKPGRGVFIDPPAEPPADSTTRTHTVKQGETLSSIAKAAYGDSRQYKAILAANPGLDASKMRPGTEIKLPPASSKNAIHESKGSEAASGGVTAVSDSRSYLVQSGDSLYKITRKLYGTNENQEKIYELNKQMIGPDSTRLKPGMILKLPTAPTAQ